LASHVRLQTVSAQLTGYANHELVHNVMQNSFSTTTLYCLAGNAYGLLPCILSVLYGTLRQTFIVLDDLPPYYDMVAFMHH